ncbi:MAG: hypothetical protein M3548_24120 [Actinomycetota bacterium]|nr:hypothetical protein [Actinomycetota bacterium]
MPDDQWRAAAQTWALALKQLTATEEAARAWREERYKFAHRLGQALTAPLVRDGVGPIGPVLYGVWLNWGLLYVGQSDNTDSALRRLRDLPVGESHHLGNTFPPEIWDRIVVIPWTRLPEAKPFTVDRKRISLGLEHRLQMWLRPLANSSRRTSGGAWRDVRWEDSRSVGARVGAEIDGLFTAVQQLWIAAARSPTEIRGDKCLVIFPGSLLDTPQGPGEQARSEAIGR